MPEARIVGRASSPETSSVFRPVVSTQVLMVLYAQFGSEATLTGRPRTESGGKFRQKPRGS